MTDKRQWFNGNGQPREVIGETSHEGKTYLLVGTGFNDRLATEDKFPEIVDKKSLDKLIEHESYMWGRNKVSRERDAEEKRLAEDRLAALTSLDGFENSLSPMERGRAVKTLTKSVSRHGKITSIRDLIRDLVGDGWRTSRHGLESQSGNIIDEKTLTKIGIKYADYLIKNNYHSRKDTMSEIMMNVNADTAGVPKYGDFLKKKGYTTEDNITFTRPKWRTVKVVSAKPLRFDIISSRPNYCKNSVDYNNLRYFINDEYEWKMRRAMDISSADTAANLKTLISDFVSALVNAKPGHKYVAPWKGRISNPVTEHINKFSQRIGSAVPGFTAHLNAAKKAIEIYIPSEATVKKAIAALSHPPKTSTDSASNDETTPSVEAFMLWIDNTQLGYNMKNRVYANLIKKRKKGIYNSELAAKGFNNLVVNAAHIYCREFKVQKKWTDLFPLAFRKKVAVALEKEFMKEMEFRDRHDKSSIYNALSGPEKGDTPPISPEKSKLHKPLLAVGFKLESSHSVKHFGHPATDHYYDHPAGHSAEITHWGITGKGNQDCRLRMKQKNGIKVTHSVATKPQIAKVMDFYKTTDTAGKSLTPKYRLEYRDNDRKSANDKIGVDGKPVKTMIWRGPATPKALEKTVKAFNKSFEKDGANYHVSKSAGAIVRIHYAAIVDQKTNKAVATYQAPLFDASSVNARATPPGPPAAQNRFHSTLIASGFNHRKSTKHHSIDATVHHYAHDDGRKAEIVVNNEAPSKQVCKIGPHGQKKKQVFRAGHLERLLDQASQTIKRGYRWYIKDTFNADLVNEDTGKPETVGFEQGKHIDILQNDAVTRIRMENATRISLNNTTKGRGNYLIGNIVFDKLVKPHLSKTK